jgi:hypothetical protein
LVAILLTFSRLAMQSVKRNGLNFEHCFAARTAMNFVHSG